MEKTVKIIDKKDQTNDLDYWLSQPPEKRLDAIEIYRQQYINTLPENERKFQRVLTITHREKS